MHMIPTCIRRAQAEVIISIWLLFDVLLLFIWIIFFELSQLSSQELVADALTVWYSVWDRVCCDANADWSSVPTTLNLAFHSYDISFNCSTVFQF